MRFQSRWSSASGGPRLFSSHCTHWVENYGGALGCCAGRKVGLYFLLLWGALFPVQIDILIKNGGIEHDMLPPILNHSVLL